MAVAPVSSPTILTHYLRESPKAVAEKNERLDKMWSAAAKATTAALFVFSTIILAALILTTPAVAALLPNLPPVSGAMSATIFLLLLSTPIFGHYSSKFAQKAENCRNLAEIERGVAGHLEKLSSWQKPEIEAYLNENKIPLDDPLPLEARLPLIARLNFWKETYAKGADDAYRHIREDHPETYLKTDDLDLRYAERIVGFSKIESEVLPAILQGVVTYELLARPHQELELSALGKCSPRSLGRRVCAMLMDREIPDPYFYFNSSRTPLTSWDIENNRNDLSLLHQKMFG